MTTKFDYDVLYIGGGHGSHDGAAPLAGTGVRVGVIESGLMGGTCTNRGCNAKIALDEAVKLTRESNRLGDILNHHQMTINWSRNMAHKQDIIDPLPAGLEQRLTSNGATPVSKTPIPW